MELEENKKSTSSESGKLRCGSSNEMTSLQNLMDACGISDKQLAICELKVVVKDVEIFCETFSKLKSRMNLRDGIWITFCKNYEENKKHYVRYNRNLCERMNIRDENVINLHDEMKRFKSDECVQHFLKYAHFGLALKFTDERKLVVYRLCRTHLYKTSGDQKTSLDRAYWNNHRNGDILFSFPSLVDEKFSNYKSGQVFTISDNRKYCRIEISSKACERLYKAQRSLLSSRCYEDSDQLESAISVLV